MKKNILATTLLVTATTYSQADVIGAKAGYDYWNTTNHGVAQSIYAQFEHPLPLIPDIGLTAAKFDNDKKIKFNSYDLFAYYKILDNAAFSLDLGLGARRLENGKIYNQSFNDTLPMITADVELFPDNQFSFYSKLTIGKKNDTKFFDAAAGVRFQLFTSVSLQASYRYYYLNLDGFNNINNSERIYGPQLGLHIDI